MKISKRISAVLLLFVLTAVSFISCSSGNGIEQIAWGDYDQLIEDIKNETNPGVREELLHRAETMLMSTECIVPLYNYRDVYMMKSSLAGVYTTPFGAKYFMYAGTPDNSQLFLNFCELPDSTDPAFAESVTELTIVANTFSGLYTYDSEGNTVPDLVADVKISEDKLTYTFTLKTGVKWSDGTSIGASDFVYSWRRIADPSVGSPYEYLMDVIARDEENKLMIEADETNTILTVTLSSPCDYFIDFCAFPAFYPVKQMLVEYADGYMDRYGNILDADAWTLGYGYTTSGPYSVTSRTETAIVLTANKNYYNYSSIKIPSITVVLGTDPEAAYDSYRADELHYIGAVPISEQASLKTDPEFHVDDINSVYYFSYNYNSSVFKGLSVMDAAKLRRAISLYIDREYIVSQITGNGETVATAVVPENISDGCGGLFRYNDYDYRYRDRESCGFFSKETEKNRERARELLVELGMDNDRDGVLDPEYRCTMTYLTVKNTVNIMIAQAILQDLSEIGVTVKINAVDKSIFEYEQEITVYDFISNRAVAYYDNPLSILEHWVIDADQNYAGLGKKIVIENENAY